MNGMNINLLISVLIVIAIFLLLREFWCWYFKINKISNLLEEQLEEQKKNNTLLRKIINNETKELNKPMD